MTTAKRGRPRRTGADEEILTVALELVRSRGYRDFNVDEVSERTGIAKTTIYRRWPSKGSLVAAAIAPMTPPDGADVAAILDDTAAALRLLGNADADAIDVVRAIIEPRHASLSAALGNDARAALRADALLGSLVIQLLRGEELSDSASLLV